jgi:hypothetical protein
MGSISNIILQSSAASPAPCAFITRTRFEPRSGSRIGLPRPRRSHGQSHSRPRRDSKRVESAAFRLLFRPGANALRLYLTDHASDARTFRRGHSRKISSRSEGRLLAFTFGDLLRDNTILSDASGRPFRRGHQVKWFVHCRAVFLSSRTYMGCGCQAQHKPPNDKESQPFPYSARFPTFHL